jgi:glutaminyl-peptide cyclotransferase
VLVACALAGCGSDDTSAAPLEPAVPAAASALAPAATVDRFNGVGAFALLREQVQDYGWRPAGSPALRRLAVRLRALMPRGRFENVPGHPGLRNVVGSVPGRMPAIVVGAHYDVEAAPEGFVGANDGAAGTAAVVTLARAFARAPRPRNARALRFVLFDGEEEPAGCEPFTDCGIRGSKAYAKRHQGETRALVLLDYIAEKQGLRFTREAGSDPALWAQLRRAAAAAGVGARFSAPVSGEIIDDHWPFTRRGVRAIDLIDFDYPQRDSLDDDLDAVSARSLDAVGEAVFALVATLRRRG